ncbi:uncharacterized protein LOC105662025 [Megachile rotundata]|uniref:uncharacterized protein LOC105662025 n=1 Tax=Megachile rotundata TaxID=143995 RepID=UPI003FD5207C
MEEINDSSYLKSTLSSEDSRLKECLNDAILLSSNEEILSKSFDEIFYDTNEFSFSWNNNITESDISDVSDVEIYKSCSNLLEDNDTTSFLALPPSKPCGKIINDKDPDPVQNLDNFQNSIKEDCEADKNVPLKIVLKRMFHEILGKYMKEPNTACSVSEPNNNVKINNNDSESKLSESNHSYSSESVDVTLPSDDTSVDVSSKCCQTKLETILEQSNENYGTTYQPPSSWSEKCIKKLTNFPCRKFNKHWISDKIFITGDTEDSVSSESNASCDIEMLSMEIFKKLNDFNNNNLINSIDWNSNTFNINNVLINTNGTSNEESNLVKSKRCIIPPAIFITPATPT